MRFSNLEIKGFDKRTKNVGKNSLYMVIIQLVSIALSLVLVPLTIGYVNPDIYGVWLTLSSIVGWISVLNIGLNNSLRNRFTEARTLGDDGLAHRYVSTTYALLSLIFGVFLIVFLCVNQFLNWSMILNLPPEFNGELHKAMAIIVAYFCMRFILSTINMILLADQRAAENSLRSLIEQFLSFIIIWVLTKTTEGSLLYLCLALCVTPVLVLIIFNVSLFRNRYKLYAPSIFTVDFSLCRDLFSVGIKFFIISIAGIIQFQLTNFLILRYYGGEQVTCYNIAYKYFNVAYVLFLHILTPLWSAVTEAKVKHDYKWIKAILNKYLLLGLVFSAGVVLMLILSDTMYHVWLRDNYIYIPFSISMVLAIYNVIAMIGGIYVNILNGMGVLNTQMLVCVVSPFLYLVLCYLMIAHTQLGIVGIVIASILSNFNAWLIAPVQVYKSIKRITNE